MSKIIVLSGHGSWEMKDGYTTLPGNCSIKFYTCNMRTLSDSLGGDIDRGIISGLVPSQQAGPYTRIPNMRLYAPNGLNIRKPGQNWEVVVLGRHAVPPGNRNLQVTITENAFPNGLNLDNIFYHLSGAMREGKCTLLWAACRAIGLNTTKRGARSGINSMQR